VIIKSLEKNRENRFQTATKFKSELLTALKQIQENNDSDSNNKFVPNTDITSNASLIDKKEVVETNDKQYKTDIESDESNNFYMSQNIAPLDTEIERGKKKHSILVLDDDNTILDIISHILSNADCSVFTSTNIGTIHSYLFMNNVDLLITDLNMPQLNGVQVCKLFKKTLPSLKILLFSNIPERDLAKKAKEACADGYISKNTTPNEWIQAIKGYLD
jgi:CheY-like chemotaxis protein